MKKHELINAQQLEASMLELEIVAKENQTNIEILNIELQLSQNQLPPAEHESQKECLRLLTQVQQANKKIADVKRSTLRVRHELQLNLFDNANNP